jgi:hypothetical protein
MRDPLVLGLVTVVGVLLLAVLVYLYLINRAQPTL